ncbi:hypothetical protein LBMAG21_10950 [Armatimonadota bacterium]|nr:hypothetical protein LBMAG21_10950 [Armatimonadota bacterium]
MTEEEQGLFVLFTREYSQAFTHSDNARVGEGLVGGEHALTAYINYSTKQNSFVIIKS